MTWVYPSTSKPLLQHGFDRVFTEQILTACKVRHWTRHRLDFKEPQIPRAMKHTPNILKQSICPQTKSYRVYDPQCPRNLDIISLKNYTWSSVSWKFSVLSKWSDPILLIKPMNIFIEHTWYSDILNWLIHARYHYVSGHGKHSLNISNGLYLWVVWFRHDLQFSS